MYPAVGSEARWMWRSAALPNRRRRRSCKQAGGQCQVGSCYRAGRRRRIAMAVRWSICLYKAKVDDAKTQHASLPEEPVHLRDVRLEPRWVSKERRVRRRGRDGWEIQEAVLLLASGSLRKRRTTPAPRAMELARHREGARVRNGREGSAPPSTTRSRRRLGVLRAAGAWRSRCGRFERGGAGAAVGTGAAGFDADAAKYGFQDPLGLNGTRRLPQLYSTRDHEMACVCRRDLLRGHHLRRRSVHHGRWGQEADRWGQILVSARVHRSPDHLLRFRDREHGGQPPGPGRDRVRGRRSNKTAQPMERRVPMRRFR